MPGCLGRKVAWCAQAILPISSVFSCSARIESTSALLAAGAGLDVAAILANAAVAQSEMQAGDDGRASQQAEWHELQQAGGPTGQPRQRDLGQKEAGLGLEAV